MQAFLGFPRHMLGLLRCVVDSGKLSNCVEIRSDDVGITDGSISCVKCGHEYQIEGGIVRMMTSTLTQETEHEIALKDEEYEAMPEVFVHPPSGWRSEFIDRIEIPPHLATLGQLEGRRVLEIGCGDGRFTMLMAQLGAEVLAVDFSIAALRKLSGRLFSGEAPTSYSVANRRCFGDLRGRVGLVQADASNFHAAPRSFQRALSATPLDTRDERMKMYCAIAEALTDDGRYIAGVEYDDLCRRLLGLPLLRRYTPGGVLIEHFGIPTIQREMAPYFHRFRMRPIRVCPPFLKRLRLSMTVQVAVARMLGAIPLARHLGTILLICAERPARVPQEGVRRPDCFGARRLYRKYKQWRGEEPEWDCGEPV